MLSGLVMYTLGWLRGHSEQKPCLSFRCMLDEFPGFTLYYYTRLSFFSFIMLAAQDTLKLEYVCIAKEFSFPHE